MAEGTREWAIQWKNDAIADGWKQTDDRVLKMSGYVAHVCHESDVSCDPNGYVIVWGPDHLQITIDPAKPYSRKRLEDGLRTCMVCKATDIDPHRFSFAGRCCATCLPDMRRQHEFPGWTD